MLNKFLAMFFFSFSSAHSLPVHIVSKTANLDLTTEKVAHITDVIDYPSQFVFEKEVADTMDMPGPRVIIIDSPGGRVDIGDEMIRLMLLEKQRGVKMICVANQDAHSMAFNFLTFCDVRLATSDTHFVVHKVALGGIDPNTRLTAKALQELADEMVKIDENYRQANSKAMHLSLSDYDRLADEQHMWSAPMLYLIGYLDGICTVDDPSVAPAL